MYFNQSQKKINICLETCFDAYVRIECLKLSKEHSNKITYIKLSKNVGEHNAVMAGLKYSFGDWVIIMDDDFQNPPSEALKLFNYANSNKFDVIYGDYKDKSQEKF